MILLTATIEADGTFTKKSLNSKMISASKHLSERAKCLLDNLLKLDFPGVFLELTSIESLTTPAIPLSDKPHGLSAQVLICKKFDTTASSLDTKTMRDFMCILTFEIRPTMTAIYVKEFIELALKEFLETAATYKKCYPTL